MMSAQAFNAKLAALPGPILDHLYSEHIGELNGTIIARNKLTAEEEPKLFLLLRELYVREVPFGSLQPEIEKRFGFEAGKARQLAVDIAGYRLLPLDRWIGDVTGYIRRLGGDSSAYPPERIQMVERTRDEAAAEIVSASSSEDATTRVIDRMQDVVATYLAGVRTELQALEVLTRSDKIGGVGLDPAAAQKVIDQAKEEARAVLIKDEPFHGAQVPSSADQAAFESEAPTAGLSAPAPKKDDFITIKPEDEQEIERVKEVVLPAKGAEQAADTSRRIELAVDRITLTSGLKIDDEDMLKRIKTVIGNRLRDVRDQMETLETMVQPKELGGLGLSQDAARTLLTVIQASLKEVHESHAELMQEEKAQWVRGERQKEAEAPAKQAAADSSELERMFQSIVAKSKKATMMAAQSEPVAAPISVPTIVPVIPPLNLPIADTNPVPPGLRAPVVAPLPLPKPAVTISPPTILPTTPPLTLVRPVPGVPVLPPRTVRGPGETERPRMEDVKGSMRLTGPVEELRAITVVDFRRLSKDPKEACMKVKDKIDLLAEQSYTRRTEGIAAWSASEVVQTYLELMRESLNGVPLKEAIAARQAGKKPYVTPEEFQAVAELSRQLRY